jgi:hypothetical protein
MVFTGGEFCDIILLGGIIIKYLNIWDLKILTLINTKRLKEAL